jgi:hypothetical protein
MEMLPLILSFVPYALLFTDAGNTPGYIYPPIAIQALMISAASGQAVPATGIIAWMRARFIEGRTVESLNPLLALAATLAWLAALYALSAAAARRVKAVRPEGIALR